MKRVSALVGVMLLALGAHADIAHAMTIEGRKGGEVRSLSVIPAAGRAEVVVAVAGSVDVQDFALGSPPRIVLDLKGATLSAPVRMYDKVERGGVVNVRVAQYRDDVVRVVIDLDSDHEYRLTRGDGEIRVAVDGGADVGSFAAWRTNPEISGALASSAGTVVPAARVTPTSRRDADLSAELEPFKPESTQPKITVTFQQADIRDVISAFAVYSGRTIVVGKGVTGNVSAEVRDQPWDVALRAILTSQGLAAKEDQDGIISVDSYQNIAAQQAAEPLSTRIVSINYARASSLAPTIEGLLSKECSIAAPGGQGGSGACKVRGSVTADSATNRLLITDVASRLDDIAQYVKDLDVRTPQVAIKAKIILVNRTNIEDIGVSYDLGDNGTFFNKLVQRTDPATGKPFDKNTSVIQLGGNSLAAVSNATQRVTNPALSLIFSTALGRFDLTSFIDALQEVRLADVQAEPSIVTLDNRKAELLSGEETPIRIVDLGSLSQGGSGGQGPRATVQFKESGIILSVTPHITNNRQILMTLHAERSQLQPAASDLGYTFLKQRADNELLVADGETAVIGGLTVTQVQQSKVGIPLLVDLPLVGKLFGETRTEETKNDLLILVTPHIIDEGEQMGPPGGE
ncbi:MAG TPA: AMIN domain-containing protein [Gemmatimonadaceae bacterium]|nr:AMIN domain-containing protein [Gemmatimonadaceae bacterium]